MNLLSYSQLTGIRLAEVAFLLILIAGVWLVAAQILGLHKARTIVAGVLLAVAGLLLIIATRYAHFG